jgi:cytochrome c biogenesis protein CcdA
MIGTLGLARLAGVLTALSPCVLPILPIVLGTAASTHRLGPLALAAGLALSFTAIGLFVATVGFAAGLDTDFFRTVSAILLIGVGLVLLVPKLQEQFALAAAPVSNWAGGYTDNFTPSGLAGQFALGLLLGAVWSPCVGPTLGAASVLAAKGEDLGQVALTMLAFGIGAALPLMLLGFVSREAKPSSISGKAAPRPKASMVSATWPRSSPLAASTEAAPSVGPTHGLHTAPRRSPSANWPASPPGVKLSV